jgi:hypothetical protein
VVALNYFMNLTLFVLVMGRSRASHSVAELSAALLET